MNWFNLRISLLHAPEYVGCEPVARATWLNLSIYCCEQENGGRIRNCREWKCRQWQQTAGVTLSEINASGPLVEWDGDDIILWNYPIEREEEVRLLRESGRKGGKSKSERKIEAARLNGAKRKPSQTQATLGLEPKQEPKGNPSLTQGVTQRKGSTKEEEVQGERNENPPEEHTDALSRSDFPKVLDTEKFHSAWNDYLYYRKMRRLSKLQPCSITARLNELSEWGEEMAIRAIRATIANGWQGIFPPNQQGNGQQGSKPKRPQLQPGGEW